MKIQRGGRAEPADKVYERQMLVNFIKGIPGRIKGKLSP